MAALMMRMFAWCGMYRSTSSAVRSACRQHVLDRVAQDGDRPAEDGPAVHVHVVQALVEQFGRRRHAAAAGGPAQQVAAASRRRRGCS